MRKRIIAGCVLGIVVQSVMPTGAGARQTASSATTSCAPVFETTQYHRSVPSAFVDQGLESLPRLYPKHVLLVQRRDSELGAVRYSLLVYRQDTAKPAVTVEGMAVHNTQAWRFTAHCSTENVADGIVTTLERIARLPDGGEKRLRLP